MKCEECKFCKYDNLIKEFVCSIEPDFGRNGKGL